MFNLGDLIAVLKSILNNPSTAGYAAENAIISAKAVLFERENFDFILLRDGVRVFTPISATTRGLTSTLSRFEPKRSSTVT